MCKAISDRCSNLKLKKNVLPPVENDADGDGDGEEEGEEEARVPSVYRTSLVLSLSIFLILFGICCVGYGAVGYRTKYRESEEIDRVSGVLHVGDAGTRLMLYSYTGHTFKILKEEYCEHYGLTKYKEEELSTLKTKLTTCLREGAKELPRGNKVPIYVMATTAMRLLKLTNDVLYHKIWALLKDHVHKSQFKVCKADIIDGAEQAKLTWIAANYLRQTIRKDGQRYGIIDLGNTSLRLAFHDENTVAKSSQTIHIDGYKTSISTHSYHCYGVGEMKRRVLAEIVKVANYSSTVTNPCYFKGYSKKVTSVYLWESPCSTEKSRDSGRSPNNTYSIKGTGDFYQCHRILSKVFQTGCSNKKENCDVDLPTAHGKVLALSTFHQIATFLHITPGAGKTRYHQAASWLCSKKWSDFTAEYSRPNRCFETTYVYYLLVNGFKFNRNAWRIEYIKKINGIDVKWPFGLVYMNKEDMYPRMKHYVYSETKPGLIMVAALGPVCFVIGLYNTIKACKRKHRQFITA